MSLVGKLVTVSMGGGSVLPAQVVMGLVNGT